MKVSPIPETVAFAFDAAAANTSEKCPASPAFILNAVSASVTISDVVAAKLRIPSIPFSISSVFHPAIAI